MRHHHDASATARVAVVTGAGSGLGAAISRELGDRGFTVVVTDVDDAAAAEVAAQVPGACAMPLDVGDPAAHRAVAEVAAARGRLEVWVNNAAVLHIGPAWEQHEDALAHSMGTNALGVMYGAHAAVHGMRVASEGARTAGVADGAADPGRFGNVAANEADADNEADDAGYAADNAGTADNAANGATGDTVAGAHHTGHGDIVNIASFAAYGPLPNLAGYVASKHAVLGFTTSLQADLDAAGLPIRAHVVCVDGMDTPMLRAHADDPAAVLLTAGGRLLDPAVVARRVLGVLGTRRLVSSVPAGRGVTTRLVGLVPRLANRLTAALTRRARGQ